MLAEPLTLYKLMILYMLKQVKFPLTNSQFSEFFLDKEYTTYFTLQQALSELLESNLIRLETVRNTSRYYITREGEETLNFFGKKLSSSITDDINRFLHENKIRLRDEVNVIADYFKASGMDYTVHCEVREGKSSLIELNVSVPSKEQAEAMCNQWGKANQKIYSFIMQELMQ